MFSNRELEKQDSKLKKYMFLGFLPTIILVVSIFLYQTYSIEYNKKAYFKIKNKEIKGVVISKYEENENLRAQRNLILDTNYEQFVYKWEYDKISIGDSVIKNKGSDSIFFYLKNGNKVSRDLTFFERNKYFKLLKKNN